MSSEPRAEYASFSSIQLLKLENWVEPFPKHWHDEWGIALTEKGVNRFWHRGGWHDSDADTIIVVPPGEIHDGGLARDPWAERMIYIPVEVMERIAHACSKQRQPLTFVSTVIRDDGLAASLRGLHHTLSTGGPEAGEADELQVRVIGTLLERHGSVRIDVPRSDERAVIRRAKHLMRERASTPITLPDLANDVGMSLYHFIREFQRRVGMTPHAYLRQLRVTIARRLLRGNDPISAIAFQAGFADQAHLTREFRRTTGVTPGAFRAARP